MKIAFCVACMSRFSHRLGVAAALLLIVADLEAAWPEMPAIKVPKPELPRFLTKPTKVQTELPPKEAAEACIATAKDLLDHGHDREATLLFERARGLDPKRTELSRFLAVCYDRQNETTKAKSEFDQSLKLAPHDADLWNDYGYFFYRRSDWSQAERNFRESLKLNPKLERAKINLGMSLGQQARFQEAFDVFSDAVGPAAAHSNIGVLLAKQGRHAEAINAFQSALSLQPELTQAQACLQCLTSSPKTFPSPQGSTAAVSSRTNVAANR
jgi:Tfp pilus assembly protein PilF